MYQLYSRHSYYYGRFQPRILFIYVPFLLYAVVVIIVQSSLVLVSLSQELISWGGVLEGQDSSS